MLERFVAGVVVIGVLLWSASIFATPDAEAPHDAREPDPETEPTKPELKRESKEDEEKKEDRKKSRPKAKQKRERGDDDD